MDLAYETVAAEDDEEMREDALQRADYRLMTEVPITRSARAAEGKARKPKEQLA